MSQHAAPAKRRRKKKSGKGIWIFILILAILVAGGGWYTLGLRAVEPGSEEEVVVEIPQGTGASMIVEILDEAGLVRNKTCAKLKSKAGKSNYTDNNSGHTTGNCYADYIAGCGTHYINKVS